MIAMVIAALLVVVVPSAVAIVGLVWRFGPRRGHEPGFKFVYVNQDGSAREVSPGEQAYLCQKFSGGDGGRPYIKSRYESSDGWGSQSGFILRRQVPARVKISPVHPDYDERVKGLGHDPLGPLRAAGDLMEKNDDGSITFKRNPDIPQKERFERSRQHVLAEQRRREALGKVERGY